MHEASIIPETKSEAFARLRPTCRESLRALYPLARPNQIEAMLPTSLELEYAGERSQFYRDAKGVRAVLV